jgi:hypothetical protein
MHLAQRLWFGGAALAMTAVLTLGDTGPVHAQKKNVPTVDSTGQLTQALQTIHATRLVLENADHDYGGHRAAAVKALGGAQHQLRLALGIKGVKGPKTPKTTNPMPEAQALSDMQLAQAIPVLKQTVTTMNNAGNDYRGHRADAVRDLNEAISQLEKALKYRKDKDEKKGS